MERQGPRDSRDKLATDNNERGRLGPPADPDGPRSTSLHHRITQPCRRRNDDHDRSIADCYGNPADTTIRHCIFMRLRVAAHTELSSTRPAQHKSRRHCTASASRVAKRRSQPSPSLPGHTGSRAAPSRPFPITSPRQTSPVVPAVATGKQAGAETRESYKVDGILGWDTVKLPSVFTCTRMPFLV